MRTKQQYIQSAALQVAIGCGVVVLALLTYLLPSEALDEGGRRCAAIVVLAAGLWATEVIPLYGTSCVTVVLLSLFVPASVDQGGTLIYLQQFAHPVIMLFLGGLTLAVVFRTSKADLFVVKVILKLFGFRPSNVLLGVMMSTAWLSMWISNTAATALMFGIAGPLLSHQLLSRRWRRVLALAIAFSANVGGMTTPIGSPPNALAIGSLDNLGYHISFVTWMLLAIPLALLVLLFSWRFLLWLAGSEDEPSVVALELDSRLTSQGVWVMAVASGMLLLWLTSSWHHIPESVTALMGVAVFTASGLLGREQFSQLQWPVLFLMWGGLAMGTGMEVSGLGSWIVHHALPAWSGHQLVLLFAGLALMLSLFISNTATAALLLPLAITATQGDPTQVAIMIALASSMAMVFPVSTPPNALAYSYGLFSNREMMAAGSVITFTGFAILLAGFWWFILFVVSP